jgi:hypothetical protein
MRLGVFISYLSITTGGVGGWLHDVEMQARLARLIDHPGIQLVGIAEPNTTHHGPIERTLRDYELVGGLVDASDADSLQTLDVIIIGINFAMAPQVARAFASAVRSGVGLLNDFWTGGHVGTMNGPVSDLMLAASPVFAYHTPGQCGQLLPARVVREDPLLPGLRVGDEFPIWGCGPAMVPAPAARPAIVKDRLVAPHEHNLPRFASLPMPAWTSGELGRGRVVAVSIENHMSVISHLLKIPASEYLMQILTWLAEPRREIAW